MSSSPRAGFQSRTTGQSQCRAVTRRASSPKKGGRGVPRAGLADHDALREICFRDDDRAELLQRMDQRRISVRRGKSVADISQGRVQSFDVELIL